MKTSFYIKIAPPNAVPGSYEMDSLGFELDSSDMPVPENVALPEWARVLQFHTAKVTYQALVLHGLMSAELASERLTRLKMSCVEFLPDELHQHIK